MCFHCGGMWPWAHPVQLAPPPVKEEVIYLDENPGFYADTREGIHPPGQVWTSNQPASQQYQYYHYPGVTPTASYYYGGQFNPFQVPTATYPPYKNPYSFMPYVGPGGPTVMPMPTCPTSMSAQASAALATNATLAAMPSAPNYFVGVNPADITAQQAIVAGMMGYEVKPSPTQLVPYKPADGQQFWCKEVDGSWTLRTHTDVIMGDISPGHWERHATSGYFFWVRHVPGT